MTHQSAHLATTDPREEAQDGLRRLMASPDALAVWLMRRLEGQLSVLTRLDELSHRQQEVVRRGDTGQLLEVLRQRSDEIDALSRLTAELAPVRSRWSEVQAVVKPNAWNEIEVAMTRVEAMAAEIARRDSEDRDEIEASRDAASREIASLQQGTAAVAAYGKPAAPAPKFHDREG